MTGGTKTFMDCFSKGQKHGRFKRGPPRSIIRVLVNTWLNQQQSFLLFPLIFAILPPSSPPVCVCFLVHWEGRQTFQAWHTQHNTQAHTTYTPPPPSTFHTNLQPWLSPFIRLRSLSHLGLESVRNLDFRHLNFPSFALCAQNDKKINKSCCSSLKSGR